MLEIVANVSEGRDLRTLDRLAGACGPSLLDRHHDPDHHRSVFTLAGPGARDAVGAATDLARAAGAVLDLSGHDGVHPRLGIIDVVAFVALDEPDRVAVDAARAYGHWLAAELEVPVLFYDRSDPEGRSLPEARRDAFTRRAPDLGPRAPHPRLGAACVGARPPLVAINCRLDRDDLALATSIAAHVRERDGGLPGVRALGLRLASAGTVQVSMNLVALDQTGVETACTRVRALAAVHGATVSGVELVGLLPEAELARCSTEFTAWAGLTPGDTIEARLAGHPAER